MEKKKEKDMESSNAMEARVYKRSEERRRRGEHLSH
jgi:hypothetical protein